MFSENYVRLILALAPLVVCLAFSLDRQWWTKRTSILTLLCGLLFSASVWSSSFGVWGAVPWLCLCSLRALGAVAELRAKPHTEVAKLAESAALIYLPVGGIWALFDQLQFRPLGFSEIIVLLTGVHFHYAGFALPKLTGLWLREVEVGATFKLAGWGVILGVPLVAVGITTSQLKMPFWIEILSVTILATAAFTVSIGQLQWALTRRLPAACKVLFALGGLALAGGMILATLYGWRTVFPVAWATIPAMYAIHGTLNSLGFCLPGFIAWKILARSDSGR